MSSVLHRGSNCSPSRAMDDRIMRHGIIRSCQSAATSDFRDCKALLFESRKQRYNKYPDLYL